MGKLCQLHTAIAASFGTLVMGLLNVWPSYTLDLYTSRNTTVLSAPMTEFESSMLGSLPALGAMIGTVLLGPLIDRTGRQKGGVIITLPYVLSWAIIGLTTSSTFILAARFLSGIPAGAFLVFGPIFISEVAEDSIRGALASIPIMFYCIGVLVSYLFGWFLSYMTIIWANLACSVFGAVLCFLAIESPIFLVRQNRDEDARKAIAQYRGVTSTSRIVFEELSKIKDKVTPAVEMVSLNDDSNKKATGDQQNYLEPEQQKLNLENEVLVNHQKMSSIKLLFLSPSSRRAFLVVATLMFMQIFMGTMTIQVYAKGMFDKAAPSLPPHLCSVLLALVLVVGSIVPTLVADKAGRRILLISSSTLVGLCLATLGFLMHKNVAPPIVSAVMIFVACFSFYMGAGSVPYVLLAEVFIPEVQGIASMLIIEWVWLLNFVLIAIFPTMAKLFGIHGVFYAFAVIGFTNAVFGFFFVPETKGLSNDQIQETFLRR